MKWPNVWVAIVHSHIPRFPLTSFASDPVNVGTPDFPHNMSRAILAWAAGVTTLLEVVTQRPLPSVHSDFFRHDGPLFPVCRDDGVGGNGGGEGNEGVTNHPPNGIDTVHPVDGNPFR